MKSPVASSRLKELVAKLSFEQVLSLVHSMYSTLLLSLLAIATVRLLCLAFNSRTNVNQFAHSLYPRLLVLRNMLRGRTLPLFRSMAPGNLRDASRKYLRFASFS